MQQQQERLTAKMQADKERVFIEIDKYGEYSLSDKEIIHNINNEVMSVDGTAEGWGYACNPTDYVDASMTIFDLCKSYFTKQ